MLHSITRRGFTSTILASALAAAAVFAGAAKAENLNRWVTIENRTGFTIVKFYGSHRDMTSWGRDHLGNDVLPTGYSVDINFSRDGSGYCIYDFRAEFDDGDVLEKYGVNVCKIGTYTYR